MCIRDSKELAERVDIEKVISQKLKNLETCSETDKRELIYSSCIRSAGYLNLKEYYGLIEESFYSSSPTIVGSAIEASGQTLDPRFLSFLIEKLDNNDFRDAAEKAIKNYGKEALEPLLQKLKSSETPNELRVNIPDIIGILGDQKTVDFLFHNLETDDITVRNESLKALYLLRKNYPHLKFSNQRIIRIIVEETSLYIDTLALLYSQINSASKIDKRVSEEYSDILDAKASLTDLLEKRLDGNLERIFKLLGLKYPPDEMFSVYRSIKNKVPDLHINIIEYLDNVLDTNLKKMIIPIIETAMLETITEETISNLNLRIPSEYECYEMLLNGKDIRIKIATLYLIKQLNNEKFLPLLYKLKDSPNKKINFLANESIVRIKSGN
jgi:AAA family ATP:ADP antiporter